MVKNLPFAVVALAALALPALSAAKEPTSAMIDGRGISNPIVIQDTRGDPRSPLSQLARHAGVAPAMFGHRNPDPMSRERPEGRLGPRYTVTYFVPGPDGRLYELVQDIYPYATPNPVTYMEPGVSFFETFRTHGGWFVGGPKLKQALVNVGLPERAPSNGGTGLSTPALVGIPLAAAAALALGAVAMVSLRRRRKLGTTPAV